MADRFVVKGDVVLGRVEKFPERLKGTNIGETITNIVRAVTARMIAPQVFIPLVSNGEKILSNVNVVV